MSLRMRQITPPAGGAEAGGQRWTLALHPFEDSRSSKTGQYDDSIEINLERDLFLGEVFQAAKARQGPEDFSVDKTYPEYCRVLDQAVSRIDIGALEAVPYQVRHARASADRSPKSHSLEEIMKRGRWAALSSVKRYEKGGRIADQLSKLSATSRSHLDRCQAQQADVLTGRRRPV